MRDTTTAAAWHHRTATPRSPIPHRSVSGDHHRVMQRPTNRARALMALCPGLTRWMASGGKISLIAVLSSALCVTMLTAASSKVDIDEEVANLNAVVAEAQARHAVTVNAMVDDATFVRRAWLDLGGRMPNPEEAAAALKLPSHQLRQQLIHDLVGSAAYHSHRFNQLADLLRIEHRLQGRIPAQPYIDWLKQRIASNQPYDEMVYELLVASGGMWDDDNGAVGFHLRDQGMNEDHTAITVQIFLGTQIQCAQCHDDPDGDFSRRDFLELAAFEHHVQTQRPLLNGVQLRNLRQLIGKNPDFSSQLRRLIENASSGVINRKQPKKIPHDYQYDDGQAGDLVLAQPLWGELPSTKPEHAPAQQTQRHQFAEWILDPTHSRFAAVLANRLWADLMGRGLVVALDDWGPIGNEFTLATDSALLAHLTDLVIRANYDVQALTTIIARSDVYGRVMSEQLDRQQPALAGPLMRRLSAEQVWDSLVGLSIPQPDTRPGARSPDLSQLRIATKDADAEGLVLVANNIQAASEQIDLLKSELRGAIRQHKKALRTGNPDAIAKTGRAYQKLISARDTVDAVTMYGRRLPPVILADNPWIGHADELIRASEVRQPADPNHFLQTFGQSDRSTVNAASRDGSVLQTMAMMNWVVDKVLFARSSRLRQSLATVVAQPHGDITSTVYHMLLLREPSESERQAIRQAISQTISTAYSAGRSQPVSKASRQQLVEDLAWAIVNNPEFIHHR